MCQETCNETGGYLGKKGDIICEFEFDSGVKCENPGIYKINSIKLNKVLTSWEFDNVILCGILHTHLAGEGRLSQGDKMFMEKFMKYNKEIYTEFYFPIVLPKDKIIFYQATSYKDNVKIEKVPCCIV